MLISHAGSQNGCVLSGFSVVQVETEVRLSQEIMNLETVGTVYSKTRKRKKKN